ncbi:hypothetical protein K4K57_002258 [Colletotrichum sp. SAR 10_99]|nr:hypothetical protein K4K57_002258 [Colletotrichum sp. SAR 10_99]
MRELRPRPTTASQAREDDHQEAAAHVRTVQHLASQAVVTSPTKLRTLIHDAVQSSDTPNRGKLCIGIIDNVSTAKAAGSPASECDTPERPRGHPNDFESAQSLLRQELRNAPVDSDFDPFDETTSQPANHSRAFEDVDSQTPLQSRFSDFDYEEPQFDLGGNSPEPGDNDEDMAPASSTEGRSSSSWETRLEKLFETSHVDVSTRDMMLVVSSMVNDENDSSYGTSKAGLVFDFPLPPEHQFTEIQKCDKIVLLLHHAQTNGKWTCLHIVNYSAGTRNLVVACHIDCAPDRQPYDRTREKDGTTLQSLPAYDERPFPTLSENGRKRPFQEEPSPLEDPAVEIKRRFLAHWTSKAAEEDECARAAEFIPQMEKRKRRLGNSQDKLLHASSAAVNEVSRRKRIKKWASKVALLKEDHDNQDSDDQDSNDQDSDDQDSDDQNSNAEDIGIRQATDAFIELARAAGYNGESVDKATKDVKSAVKRSKELKCDLSAVCSSAEKVNTAITDLENFKRQQEVLREAITAVGRLDPENWVERDRIDLLVKTMAEGTREEDT